LSPEVALTEFVRMAYRDLINKDCQIKIKIKDTGKIVSLFEAIIYLENNLLFSENLPELVILY
jgi:hypothetical protein